jgi:hypothetical protein
MSLSPFRRSLRVAVLLPIAFAGAAAAALACGDQQASSFPPGAPIVVPSAHPSPDPPPAVPLMINKPVADAAADADAEAGP